MPRPTREPTNIRARAQMRQAEPPATLPPRPGEPVPVNVVGTVDVEMDDSGLLKLHEPERGPAFPVSLKSSKPRKERTETAFSESNSMTRRVLNRESESNKDPVISPTTIEILAHAITAGITEFMNFTPARANPRLIWIGAWDEC